MYNLVMLIGRLTADPELVTTDKGKKVLTINLAVSRTYKNADGVYEADFIRCKLWDGIAEKTCEYCHKGDLIAVRGQIRNESYETEDKEKKYITEIIVERLNFLSTRKNQDIAVFLDKFINTTELDKRFLSNSKVIENKDLLSFKYYIIRFIS